LFIQVDDAIVQDSPRLGSLRSIAVITPARRTIWHGTLQESRDLLAAVNKNCACVVDGRGVRSVSCAAHWMLVDEQRALDGLIFARRCLRERLRREEWGR
jgi:hypothetical protein